MLTVGSLFSGIGGIDLGLERAGMQVRWQVEIDPWCNKVLAKHWPDVERFADVREVGANNLQQVDVIAGGFPCQDISVAGHGVGIGGARSGLWSEYARIIRELRPRYVLVENVSALLARGLGVVIGDLAACGYDAEWDCIPASAVGAPHRRDRLWIVAYPQSAGREAWPSDGLRTSGPGEDVAHPDSPRPQGHGTEPELGSDCRQESACGCGAGAREVADPQDKRCQRPGTTRGRRTRSADGGFGNGGDWWTVEPAVGRVAHGIPQRVDRLRGLGNAVVPQVVEWIGRRIVEAEAVR